MECLLNIVKEKTTLAGITRKCGKKELRYLDFLLNSGVINKIGNYYFLSNLHPPAVFYSVKLKANDDNATLISSIIPIDEGVDLSNLISVILDGYTTKVIEERREDKHYVVTKVVKDTSINKIIKYTCVKLSVPAWRLIIEVNEEMIPYTSNNTNALPVGINMLGKTPLKIYKWTSVLPGIYGFIKPY
jgi:hypothetical protein